MTDLPSLIARLEAAEQGSRELDSKIALAIGWKTNGVVWAAPGEKFSIAWVPPHYTTSIDAALPGENIVFVEFYGGSVRPHWTAYHQEPAGNQSAGSHPTSEAIARRRAALRARLSVTTP